jgi:hypothetical protein
LGLLTGRALYSSRVELALGQEAYERGDRQGAVVHLRRAAHWYAPGNPAVTTALGELRRIGRQAEMEGQAELALSAYRAIRSSCLGTRSFYTPHEERLAEANGRIAVLLAHQRRPPMDRGKTVGQLRDEHHEILSRVEAPAPLWAAVACFAFLLWIGGAFAFIFFGLDEELRIQRRKALSWALVVAVGLILWVVGLLLA